MSKFAAIEDRLTEFVEALQEMARRYHGESENSVPTTYTLERGKVYIRVVENRGPSRQVYCFLDAEGGIYKAASWKAPAKHKRGSIFDENFSIGKGLGIYGANYLR